MSIKKFAVFLTVSGITGTSLTVSQPTFADTLVVNGEITCNNVAAVDWANDQLSITCDDSFVEPPVVQPPVINPPIVEPPVIEPPVIEPPVEPPVTQLPVGENCSNPEPDVQIEQFTGRGIDKEFTVENETVLVVPFDSGNPGDVKKLALGEPGAGEHFSKTVILSQCPGSYNPQDYDYKTSVNECVITGLELSFSVIAGERREDYPLSTYRCVLKPNTQYYINVFQRDAGNRPPYQLNTANTCRTNRCGVRVSIR